MVMLGFRVWVELFTEAIKELVMVEGFKVSRLDLVIDGCGGSCI